MASVIAIRAGLAARLETVEGLRVHEYGSALMNFMVKIAVSATADEAGQRRLDAYLDTRTDLSVKDALEADMEPLLADDSDGDLIADSVLVTGVAHYGMIEWGGVSYLGADLHVEVQAR